MFSGLEGPATPVESQIDVTSHLVDVAESDGTVNFVCSAHIETIKERFVGKKKQYAFVVNVERSDGSSSTIWRSYSDFFDCQCKLLDDFPEEAGAVRGSARSIPYLPGRKIFKKSDFCLAEERKPGIESYMKELLAMPAKISQSSLVISFFQKWQNDPECFSQFPALMNCVGDLEFDSNGVTTTTSESPSGVCTMKREDALQSHLNYSFEGSGCEDCESQVKELETAIKC